MMGLLQPQVLQVCQILQMLNEGPLQTLQLAVWQLEVRQLW